MIPFLDYKAVNAPYFEEIEAAMSRVLRSGWYVLGPEVEGFEAEYAAYCGTPHCIGVSSGLDALILILRAWKELGKLQEGDEVIVPANTYIASILAITENRLVPVLVEPDEATYNLDPIKIEAAITSKTRVIMAVHLYGQCADMDPINKIAQQHGILVMEDAAQSQGAIYKGRKSGSLSAAAAHSFYPGKNLGAIGEGGAVTTNDPKLDDMVRRLRNYGSHQKYVNEVKGVNNRLDELQAAVLRVKLAHLDADNAKRIVVAETYLKELSNPNVTLPAVLPDGQPCWHLFIVRTSEREKLMDSMKRNGVVTAIHYPIPPHKQLAYREFAHISLPVTEMIHRECVSLPISPVHSADAIIAVCEVVNNY